jgi:hypothetical protein
LGESPAVTAYSLTIKCGGRSFVSATKVRAVALRLD